MNRQTAKSVDVAVLPSVVAVFRKTVMETLFSCHTILYTAATHSFVGTGLLEQRAAGFTRALTAWQLIESCVIPTCWIHNSSVKLLTTISPKRRRCRSKAWVKHPPLLWWLTDDEHYLLKSEHISHLWCFYDLLHKQPYSRSIAFLI